MIIADTCLIFHLFNETFLTTIARDVLNKDSYWITPPLWREEYANILSKLARKEHRASDEVMNHFNFTVDEVKHCEVIVETAEALEISIKYKISVYDAHFVALAMNFNTLLITEDKEILKKCSDFASNMHDFLKI